METETKRLTAEIIKIYPEMFQGTDPNYTPWRAGLGVDLGWYPIIKRLVTTIKENDDQYNLENGTEVVTKVFDIKEKYGSLRFHPVGGTSDKNWDAIEAAENESENTCETCGSTEDVGTWTKGWIVTCCKSCAQKRTEFQTPKQELDVVWLPRKK